LAGFQFPPEMIVVASAGTCATACPTALSRNCWPMQDAQIAAAARHVDPAPRRDTTEPARTSTALDAQIDLRHGRLEVREPETSPEKCATIALPGYASSWRVLWSFAVGRTRWPAASSLPTAET
jgi:hypothetical protein